APAVLGRLLGVEVAVLGVLFRDRRGRGLLDQRHQPLLLRRELPVVGLVHAERRANALHRRLGGADLRVLRPARELGHDDGGEDADDDDDEQQLDEGEPFDSRHTALAQGKSFAFLPAHGFLPYLPIMDDRVNTGSSIEITTKPTIDAITTRSAGSKSE